MKILTRFLIFLLNILETVWFWWFWHDFYVIEEILLLADTLMCLKVYFLDVSYYICPRMTSQSQRCPMYISSKNDNFKNVTWNVFAYSKRIEGGIKKYQTGIGQLNYLIHFKQQLSQVKIKSCTWWKVVY